MRRIAILLVAACFALAALSFTSTARAGGITCSYRAGVLYIVIVNSTQHYCDVFNSAFHGQRMYHWGAAGASLKRRCILMTDTSNVAVGVYTANPAFGKLACATLAATSGWRRVS